MSTIPPTIPHHLPLQHRTGSMPTIISRFYQSAQAKGLKPNTKEWRAWRRKFVTAAVLKAFALHFGTNQDDVDGWRRICATLDLVSDVNLLVTVEMCHEVSTSTACPFRV